MRILSAMSGGVDSSVATARLVAAGHDVTGVHLALSRTPLAQREGARGCCSLADVHDARRVADLLGIPFYVWDFSQRFADDVVADFLDEYAAGRTPNPCLRCNEKIKFQALLERGIALGFDAVATGHYASLREGTAGQVELWRSSDPLKDQSYVLGVLNQEQLRHSLFPLEGSSKPQVRAEAAELGLGTADKPDSVDICFIPDGDTAGFLTEKLGSRSGVIVDLEGNQVGTHNGAHQFTIGQRRGLNLGIPAVDGKPRYVVHVDPANDRVVVGGAADLMVKAFDTIRPTWTQDRPEDSWQGFVQIRAHGAAIRAEIQAVNDQVRVALQTAVRGVAPGQQAVFYDGDRVVGSGVIAVTHSAAVVESRHAATIQ